MSGEKRPPVIFLFLLLLLYVAATVMVTKTSTSDSVIFINRQPVPLRMLTGAFSAICNICNILMVLYFKRTGFLISLTLVGIQFPAIFFRLFVQHNYTTISGFFSNVLIILTICLIHTNNENIKEYQTQLREQAVTDRLTGLPNRFACTEITGDLIKRGEKFALAVLNLNNFKNINNTMGQSTGNAVLIEIARQWKKIADEGKTGTLDFITYQGADEYALIIRNFNSDENIRNSLACYEDVLKNRITIDNCDYFLTANIGYALYPEDADNGEDLLACAYSALNEVRRSDDNDRIFRYSPVILNTEKILETERKIRYALENDSVFFYLQPQYDISHRLSGFEALARIRDVDGSVLSPGEFIPVAEQAGLIDKVDHAVFVGAANFFGELVRKTQTNITLSVNISVRHLMKNGFLDEVRNVLETSGVPANQLEIEITESIIIDSVERALQLINEIRKLGVKIAIDDFGTGYSSLSYLNNFPADILKVDKSFIDKMNSNDASEQYVAAIISIGHVMNFEVISEGVENPEQLETLRRIGCDFIQGFIWGRPMAPEAAEDLIMRSFA